MEADVYERGRRSWRILKQLSLGFSVFYEGYEGDDAAFFGFNFDAKYMDMVVAVRSEEYYINMMIAWYFAKALAKQYESALHYLEKKRLIDWVHNKTIQKSVESYRISDEQKAYLKTLKGEGHATHISRRR